MAKNEIFQGYLEGNLIENEDNPEVTIVETTNGRPKAFLRGFCYNMHKEIKRRRDGTMRYQCENVNSDRCPAYIWVLNGRAVHVQDEDHTHDPNPARVHHLQVGHF